MLCMLYVDWMAFIIFNVLFGTEKKKEIDFQYNE